MLDKLPNACPIWNRLSPLQSSIFTLLYIGSDICQLWMTKNSLRTFWSPFRLCVVSAWFYWVHNVIYKCQADTLTKCLSELPLLSERWCWRAGSWKVIPSLRTTKPVVNRLWLKPSFLLLPLTCRLMLVVERPETSDLMWPQWPMIHLSFTNLGNFCPRLSTKQPTFWGSHNFWYCFFACNAYIK